MILSKSLKHGWYYHYKVHKKKLSKLRSSGFGSLSSFLLAVRKQEHRPDQLFTQGPRSSQVDLDIEIDAKPTTHMVTDLAAIGLESDYYKDAHMNVQMFMLAYDTETVAIETPVWLEKDENFVDCDEASLTGHIDLLRIEDDTIWVWDYKPNAHREKTAESQVFLYATMLSRRGNIALQNIQCGYFDEQRCYAFDPATTIQGLSASKRDKLIKR